MTGIARNLLAMHIASSKITEATGLSVEEIEKLGRQG